jgi:hypothetical protein
MDSPHGNHVLQRVIELMRPSAISSVLDGLIARMAPAELARRRYGCRVLERIIEHFTPHLLVTSVGALLSDVCFFFCRHVYGDCVIHHLLEHGAQAHRRRVINVLYSDPRTCALHTCAGPRRAHSSRPYPRHAQRKCAKQRSAGHCTIRL